MFWLALAIKMVVTAAFVVVATKTAERAGSLVGAMIATLPIAAGPSYFFLALEHDDAFIADGALASLVVNAVTAIFAIVYSGLAQKRGLVLSLGAALAAWFGMAALVRGLPWTTGGAVAFNVVIFIMCLLAANWLPRVAMPPARPEWYDVPLRAGLVGLLVALVIGLSEKLGPTVTGTLAVFPIVLVSLILILHPRIGGRATASVMADTIFGLVGFSLCCLTARLLVPALGAPLGLSLALAMSVGANFGILTVRRRMRR
jgi:uncharacterized membrane protein